MRLTRTHSRTHARTHTHTHTHAHTRTRTHARMHTSTHARTQNCIKSYVAQCYIHLFIYLSLILTVLTKAILTCIYLLCPYVQGSMQLKALFMFVFIHWSLCLPLIVQSLNQKVKKYSYRSAQKVNFKSHLHWLWRKKDNLLCIKSLQRKRLLVHSFTKLQGEYFIFFWLAY